MNTPNAERSSNISFSVRLKDGVTCEQGKQTLEQLAGNDIVIRYELKRIRALLASATPEAFERQFGRYPLVDEVRRSYVFDHETGKRLSRILNCPTAIRGLSIELS